MSNISVCIITKNESEKLEKCLKSLRPYGFEIVVVDTGSTDDTADIINKYADVAGNFKWCNDFAKARNYSISLAGNDTILILDSDEWIEQCDIEMVLGFIQDVDNQKIVGKIEIINEINGNGQVAKGHEYISRLFNRNFYEYEGRIHEQVRSKFGDDSIFAKLPIVIGHSGYTGSDEEKRQKACRNIELLLLDMNENGQNPYTLYQLGKSYYMQKEFDKAATYFEEGLGYDLNPKLEYVQDMVETYGYTLLNLKRYEEMLFLKEIYDEFAVSADYVFLVGLAYMNNEMFDAAIEEFNKATTFKLCKVEGCNSYKALYNAGVICECLGRTKEAYTYYLNCKEYEPAKQGINRLQGID